VRFPSTPLLAFLLAFCSQAVGQSMPPGAPTPHSGEVPVVFVPHAPIQGSSPRQKQRVDPAELRREASQVAELSKSIQSDFEAVARGMLPKDTIEKLKKIEKLSKHLRSQIER
jgi:hypothetical protein